MTSGQQDRRALVAESYRYARAFYDGTEATGPTAFEGNRQAIIDVLALAYRDGRASQQPDDALLAAAQEARQGLEMMLAASMVGARDYDAMEWRRAANQVFELLRDALDGAPFEPSEEMVERAVEAMIDSAEETDLRELPVEARRFARAALRAAFSAHQESLPQTT